MATRRAGSEAEPTVYIQPLDDDLQLHLVGHVPQRAHGHAQLLLRDEAVPIPVKHLERLTDLCWKKRSVDATRRQISHSRLFLRRI